MASATIAHSVTSCPLAIRASKTLPRLANSAKVSPFTVWHDGLVAHAQTGGSKGRNAQLWGLQLRDGPQLNSHRQYSVRASTSSPPSVEEQEQDDPYDSVDVCELVLGNEVEMDSEGAGPQEPVEAYFAKAVKNNNGSGVLLLTDILGIGNEDTRDYAFRLACFGYNVFVPDLFRGKPWEEGRDMSGYDSWREQHDPERVASDIALAHKFLAAELAEHGAGLRGEGRIALVGFCFGGGRVVEQLAADTEGKYSAGVSFYGTRYDAKLGEKVKVPLLLIAGDSDPLVPVDFVKDVERNLKKGRGRAPSKMKIYEGRKHAFAHHPKFEDDADADDAFEVMKEWLREHLLHIEPGAHSHS